MDQDESELARLLREVETEIAAHREETRAMRRKVEQARRILKRIDYRLWRMNSPSTN